MAVAHDTSVSGSANGSNSWTLPALSTGGTNRLVIVTCHTSSNEIATPSATGLTFVQIGSDLSYSGNGKQQVYRAFAASQLSSVVITITSTNFPQVSAVASTFSGTDTTGTHGSGAIGATNTFTSGGSTAPSATITTTRNNSLVIGAFGQTSDASMTAGSNQTINATSTSPGFSRSSTDRQNSVTATSGSSVTCNETLGASVACGAMTIEVLEPVSAVATHRFMAFFN